MQSKTQLLSVKNWAAWAPGLISQADWLAWSQKPTVPSGNSPIEAKSIPPILRRRCSPLTKMAIEVSNRAIGDESIDYAIFCSQHGEIKRTVTLLKEIADKTILSPTNFAQSVHNSSAGLFSVIHKMHQNMASVAAGENTFLMGMIEALAWLKLNPKKTVLFTIFDDYLPDEYQSLHIKSNYQYAFSMLLTNSNQTLSFRLDSANQTNSKKILPQALEFLAWFLQPTKKELAWWKLR